MFPVSQRRGESPRQERPLLPSVAEFGPFRLRPDGVLFAAGRVVDLTPTEEAFLTALVEAGGARVSKETVAMRAWPATVPSDASISRCLHTLRRKLQEAAPGGSDLIATTYRRGFSLSVPVRRVEADAPQGPVGRLPPARRP
jgi:DNA-binding winged helix-turn-helix (wHTH) protein